MTIATPISQQLSQQCELRSVVADDWTAHQVPRIIQRMHVQPDAVIFDFGGTLMDDVFDPEEGNRRLHSLIETGNITIDEYRTMVSEIDRELGPRRMNSCLEHSSLCFGRLLNDCLGIQHGFGSEQQEREFWSASETWTLVPGADIVVRSWYVGDRLDTDVAGSKLAGMRSVWLNRSGQASDREIVPDSEITDWAGFRSIWPGSAW